MVRPSAASWRSLHERADSRKKGTPSIIQRDCKSRELSRSELAALGDSRMCDCKTGPRHSKCEE